jgi:hypothetical protein
LKLLKVVFVVVQSSITFSDFSIETKTKHIELFHYFLKQINEQVKKASKQPTNERFSEKN